MRQTLVLYSVLDWGLGHATRSIPVIRSLIENGCRVIIAGEGRSFLLLKREFPECTFEPLRSFQVNYPEKGMKWWLLKNLPSMWRALKSEKLQTKTLVEKYRPDAIISDHRYGFFHPAVPSVLIAHQLRIQAGIFTSLIFNIHKRLLKNYHEIWVPDYSAAPGISGELAHHPSILKSLNPCFIGPLSRLNNILSVAPDRKYDILILLSGPEPQRTLLEKTCIQQLESSGQRLLIIQGKPETTVPVTNGNITCLPGVSAEELKGLLQTIPVIICRPGYSTLMDLEETGRNAILIPTPGQTEQIYLASLHARKGCLLLKQQSLNLSSSTQQFKPLYHLPLAGEKTNVARIIHRFLANYKLN